MLLSACVLAALPAAAPGSGAAALALTADGTSLFAVRGAGAKTLSLYIWGVTEPELKAVITGLPPEVRTIQPTADGKRFVLVAGTNGRESRVEVWDVADKKKIRAFDLPAGQYGHASVPPDGNWVAYHQFGKKGATVWNTESGERADAIEKAVGESVGTFAFTPDSKQLVVAGEKEYTAFDVSTGKSAKVWKIMGGRQFLESSLVSNFAVLADGKGVVSVSPTGKRRQSYAVRLVTEKKTVFLGEFWDRASSPVVSPDGRLLIVSGGSTRNDGGGTFVLALDADGKPEMKDRDEKNRPPFGGGDEKQVPAWREWALGEATQAGREPHGAIAFSPNGKRLFVGAGLGRIEVFDTERRVKIATMFAATPTKDEHPNWHILTTTGAFAGSRAEAEKLIADGKLRSATKVREVLVAK